MSKTIEEIRAAKREAEFKIDSILAQFEQDNEVQDIDVRIEVTKLYGEGKNNVVISGFTTKIEVKI